jgi:hypothetical protein
MKIRPKRLFRSSIATFMAGWAALCLAAPKSTIELDGDLGCDTALTQKAMFIALRAAVQSSLLKAQGAASAESEQIGAAARSDYARLARTCRKLAGPFPILERQTFEGLRLLRVRYGSLWVLVK